MSKTNGVAKGVSKADQGLTPTRQKVLAYLLKRKATEEKKSVPASDVHSQAGGIAVCAALISTGMVASAKREDEPTTLYLTSAGQKALAAGKK